MSIKVLRGQGRISQWTFAHQAKRLVEQAITRPTRNVWDNETNKTKQVPTLEADRLKELESDNAFDLISDMITEANDSMMSYITGATGQHNWQLNHRVDALVGDLHTLSLVTHAKHGSVFVGTKSANPHSHNHITLYQYTGDDEPRMPYRKSLRSKILFRKEWATKYSEWRNKSHGLINEYQAHINGLKSKHKVNSTKRQLRQAEDRIKTFTQAIDDCNATLDADITAYNAEQQWLAAMPKHLLKDKPHIIGLMNDPVPILKKYMGHKADTEESARRLRVELNLLGVTE